ncbi:Vacuolar protein sorting-associated protein 1 [Venturia nashicola]|uniref:Vacuolar protein sorting-associated protein 1 n=1 Tax=Venturia nashicola TaxID=86259 RepID=A0A4Z1P2T0_9PEZI|nr:Vacuolar protein sorting-associated protein 1 [Venturia nashicola]
MRSLSLTCFVFLSLFSLSFALQIREVKEGAKPKCGDLDDPFWEWMHRNEYCEAKKSSKRPQCGEGRKKCGLPGSHCDDGVCSTACGIGKPECPKGFHCENGDCGELEEEKEREPEQEKEKEPEQEQEKSPPSKSSDASKGSMGVEDEGKMEKESSNCADGTCKQEGCNRQTGESGGGSCGDAGEQRNQTVPVIVQAPQAPQIPQAPQAPQAPKNEGFIPTVLGILKNPFSSRPKPQPVPIPINPPQIQPITTNNAET